MLSVWKLAHGQEAYYLQAVAQGVEDYYVGGEAPGRWMASSDTMIGLAGKVSADDLHAVLSGRGVDEGKSGTPTRSATSQPKDSDRSVDRQRGSFPARPCPSARSAA